MKKYYFILAALFCVNVGFAENPVVIYNGEDVNVQWGDLASTVQNDLANPDKTGINTSDFCVAIQRTGTDTENGGKPWSGGAIWNELDIDPYLYNRLSLMVLKSVEGPVSLELQKANDQEPKETIWADYTTPGLWQKLVFEVNCRSEQIQSILVKIHDTDAEFTPDPQMMYWDNLEAYYESNYPVENQVMMLYNGEDVDSYWGDLASTVARGVENPDKTGINTSDHCVSIMRNKSETDAGGQPWSGGALWGCEKMRISPSAYNRLSVMVKKSVEGPVKLELQKEGMENEFVTADYSADHLNEWQQLVFDISSRTEEIHKILIQPHATNDGLTENDITVYWDNFTAFYSNSGTTGMFRNDAVGKVSVYVDMQNQIVIHGEQIYGETVLVYNMLGQLLINRKLAGNSLVIDNTLQSGTYLVRIGNEAVKVYLK